MDPGFRLVRFWSKIKDPVPKFGHRPWNIDQWFDSLQTDLAHLTRLHVFDKQLGFDKSHWAEIPCDVKIVIRFVSHLLPLHFFQ
ncbi:MAG: hypothetical protein FD149_2440 [Rhodospirillaceae bacterium]|nr:MAG: hypothetical protein FD149_2440 [Rhodospirillaceae bacterium]